MKRMIKFGSIEQFRNTIRNIRYVTQYRGKDEDKEGGNEILDRSIKLPVIKAIGTEKIHGTNSSVCYSNPDGFWVQSKERIITPQQDNNGCCAKAEENKETWLMIIRELAEEYKIDLNENIITVYYEWCGGNIQKNSCVSGLDKMAIIFQHFKVSPLTKEINSNGKEKAEWLETSILPNNQPKIWIDSVDDRIYNVMRFPVKEILIDFNSPESTENLLIKMTEEVEDNSGIADYFNMSNKPENIGEGYVWTLIDKKGGLHKFKTKGSKHSKTKVKKLNPTDEEKVKKVYEFANYSTSAWRLEQAWDKLFNEDDHTTHKTHTKKPDIKFAKDFIVAVIDDVIKEESDIMLEKNLTKKDISKAISKISIQWFREQLEEPKKD